MAGGKMDQEVASNLAAVLGKSGTPRIEALAEALLTKAGHPRADSRFISKAVRREYPDIEHALCEARDRFAALEARRIATETAAASLALLRLASAVLARYDAKLAERSALDFDRLIAKTGDLLQRSSSTAWVLYRLDSDLAHLLIDEAQDTSPAQWELITALTGEFFSGQGAGETPRTLFAVGDEKQSIYSFQGAEPKAFADHGRLFAESARGAEMRWEHASFTVSRRSAAAVLESVDLVFKGAAASGVTADGSAIRHDAHRIGEAGLVELWPPVKGEKREDAAAWAPVASEATADPCAILAKRIARQIRHWLDAREVLLSENRAATAGDILILVRKRKPFADQMVKALKEHAIPVAGADRMRLTEQLAVMDLMVLGDFLLLPEDDLALATLLKTPFFGFDDDDLFAIGYGRPGSLWQALEAKADLKPAYGEAVARLKDWQGAARRQAPFEFYTARLEADRLRAALLARLGPDAADAIGEFLNLALRYEASEPPTLQGFLHWVRLSDPEIIRDMEQDRDEVRVMTVHGAKGLEAPIVFLADTCAFKPVDGAVVPLAIPDAPRSSPKLPVWVLNGAARLEPIRAAREGLRTKEREEYHRLLYVAMTRARDRLYVAGFENGYGRSAGCWWDLIAAGLAGRLEMGEDAFGEPVQRLECPQALPCEAKPPAAAPSWDGEVPDWLRRGISEELVANIFNTPEIPDRAPVPENPTPPHRSTLRRLG
jgi:ATP-dependent helicase/nuclease subunit A